MNDRSRGRPGFLAQSWPRIVVCAFVGFVVAASIPLVSPSGWEASVDVLVTRLAVESTDEGIDGGSPLEAELRFANSARVLEVVRGNDPTSPETIDVSLDPVTNVMTFTAPGDSANRARLLAESWAGAYIRQRREVLIDSWTERRALLDEELTELVDDLGQARLAGDDAASRLLEQQRDAAVRDQANADAALAALDRDAGAEIFGAQEPAVRTGRPLLPGVIIGPAIGAVIGGLWAWARRRRRADLDEADGWLTKASEGSLKPVLTTRSIDVPSFLDDAPVAAAQPVSSAPPGAVLDSPRLPVVAVPEAPAASITAAATRAPVAPPPPTETTPVVAPPIPRTERGWAPSPPTAAPTPATATPDVRVDASGHLPARPIVPVVRGVRPGEHAPSRASNTPLRVVSLGGSEVPAATTPPVLTDEEREWSDDFSLLTDPG